MIQNMRCETCSTELNPSLELLENVLFSIVLNHNTLSSGNVVNSYKAIHLKKPADLENLALDEGLMSLSRSVKQINQPNRSRQFAWEVISGVLPRTARFQLFILKL